MNATRTNKFSKTVDIIYAIVREWQRKRISTAQRKERCGVYLTAKGMRIVGGCYYGQAKTDTRAVVTAAVEAGN